MKKIFKIKFGSTDIKNMQYKKFLTMNDMLEFIINTNNESILKINYAIGYYQKETLKKSKCFLLKYSIGDII